MAKEDKYKMPNDVFAYHKEHGTGTWIDFDDSCHKSGDVATKYEKSHNSDLSDRDLIELVYELAFGDNAIGRDFTHKEVYKTLAAQTRTLHTFYASVALDINEGMEDGDGNMDEEDFEYLERLSTDIAEFEENHD